MFTKYTYKEGSPVEDIASDVFGLISGVSDENLLSASCVKSESYIINSRPSTWVEMVALIRTFTSHTFPGMSSGYQGTVFAATNGSILVVLYAHLGYFLGTSTGGNQFTLSRLLGYQPGGLCWSGTHFVISNNSPDTTLLISTDGLTWVASSNIGVAKTWSFLLEFNGACLGFQLGVSANQVLRFQNGNITLHTLPATVTLIGVASGNGYVLAIISASTTVYITTTGTSWAGYALPAGVTAGVGKRICFVPTLKKFFLFVDSPLQTYYTSPDGTTWTTVYVSVPQSWMSVNNAHTIFEDSTRYYLQQVSSSRLYCVRKDLFTPELDQFELLIADRIPIAPGYTSVSNLVFNGNTYIFGANNLFMSNTGGSPLVKGFTTNILGKPANVLVSFSEPGKLCLVAYEALDPSGYPDTQIYSVTQDYQAIETVYEGTLFISASNENLAFISYSQATNTWGTGSFTGVFGIDLVDPYLVDVPNICKISGIVSDAVYITRVDTNRKEKAVLILDHIAIVDLTDLALTSDRSMPAAYTLRASNFTSYTYGVLGGLIKGILQTRTNHSYPGSIVVINGVNYLAVTYTSNLRHLLRMD